MWFREWQRFPALLAGDGRPLLPQRENVEMFGFAVDRLPIGLQVGNRFDRPSAEAAVADAAMDERTVRRGEAYAAGRSRADIDEAARLVDAAMVVVRAVGIGQHERRLRCPAKPPKRPCDEL